jgi:hypothetical protein
LRQLREKPEDATTARPYARTDMNGSSTLERLRLIGGSCGAVFAVLALGAYAINTGPSSGDGVTVVEYYSTHATETLWQAALVGLAAMCLLLFAEAFAGAMALGPAGIAGAAGTAALYLVAIGCSLILGEIYGGIDLVDVSSEGYSDAHVLHVVGIGAAHMGNFVAAAYVGATAAAILAYGAPWRPLAWFGIAVTAFRLISALIELASTSRWSDVVAIAGFLVFLAWVFAASVMLVVATRRGTTLTLQTVATRPPPFARIGASRPAP